MSGRGCTRHTSVFLYGTPESGLRGDKKPGPEPFKATTLRAVSEPGAAFRKRQGSEVRPRMSLGASSGPKGRRAEAQVELGSQTTLCLGRSDFTGEKISQGAKTTLVTGTWVLHATLGGTEVRVFLQAAPFHCFLGISLRDWLQEGLQLRTRRGPGTASIREAAAHASQGHRIGGHALQLGNIRRETDGPRWNRTSLGLV